MLFAAVRCEHAIAADSPAIWLSARELSIQRGRPLTASWSETPLREALGGLSRSQHVAVFLDRRVDPDQRISLAFDAVAFEEAVERIAQRCQAEVSWYGPLTYLGPPEAARRLRTLAALREEDARRLPAERREAFARRQTWTWDDLATPRDLCRALAGEARVQVESLDLLPHDLWAAADLPPLSWTERLTLVANQFDLTFAFADDGASVRLAPIVEPVQLQRRYPGGKQPARLVKQYAELAPEAELERVGGNVLVRGRVEDHERLMTQAKPTRPDKRGKQVYTMRAEGQPLSAVLDQLRTQLRLTLTIDEAALCKAGVKLDSLISFDVKQATLEELLAAILHPAGLTFRGEDRTFEIVPDAKCAAPSAE